MLTSFYKLADTCTRQDITTFQSRCFLNSRALFHQLYRRMFSQAQACANIILQVSSYQYQAGHVLTSFYKLAHTSTRQDITTFQSGCFLNSRALFHQLYKNECANIILLVSSYQYQAGHYSISVKVFSLQQRLSHHVKKNILPSTGMCLHFTS